jgi:hypothetical protein
MLVFMGRFISNLAEGFQLSSRSSLQRLPTPSSFQPMMRGNGAAMPETYQWRYGRASMSARASFDYFKLGVWLAFIIIPWCLIAMICTAVFG